MTKISVYNGAQYKYNETSFWNAYIVPKRIKIHRLIILLSKSEQNRFIEQFISNSSF